MKTLLTFNYRRCSGQAILAWALALGTVAFAAGGTEVPGRSPANSTMTIPDTNLAVSTDLPLIEEGKALYENGQMIAALGKFMTVLRTDPHNPEARQYLRMIVDIMRQNPSISSGKMGSQEQAVSTNPAVQEEIRRMLQMRSRLTLDLKAIPGVQVYVKGNVNQVWIETPLFFNENSGGLKEQGVPILDRVSAWLKSYGQQPIIIHCYPEEMQDASANGSLFLRRYSELFNFFVSERKLPPQRFVSADLLKKPGEANDAANVDQSTGTFRIVIETIGSQPALLDAMPSLTPGRALSQWLESSIVPNTKIFNPEEGEWVTLDLAGLSRSGLRNWTFKILPSEGKDVQPVFQVEGTGNLLKRLSWDGHNQKTGDFVRAGNYVAKLTAFNSDGTIKNQEEILQVERTTKEIPVVAAAPKSKRVIKHHARAKRPKAKAIDVAKADTPPNASVPVEQDNSAAPSSPNTTAMVAPKGNEGKAKPNDSDSLIDSGAKTSATEDGGDAVHAIWKQVIQFEPNQSDLVPTVKSSLERIGKTLEVYPLQKVRITGFAMTSEAGANELAMKRAEMVRAILVDEYHVDKQRVIVAGGKTTSAENASKVEMSITN